MKKATPSWSAVAKKVWPTLKPCRPDQFANYKGVLLVAGHEHPVVMVFQGKDLQTLREHVQMCGSIGTEANKLLPAPPSK